MNKIRPFLKWAGNKYHCLEHLLDSFPKASRLIEPFAGSGVVFMNTQFESYLLAEENQDVIALYQHLKEEGESFIQYCQRWFVEANNTAERYYGWREKFNNMAYSRRRAAVFLYLNRYGYNGLCRYNSKGGYNVPFGRYQKPYFPQNEMLAFYEKSQKAEFKRVDFRETFLEAKKGDVIYCDPPYVPLKQSTNFSNYTGKKFSEADQLALVDCTLDALKRGIPVLISNHDTPFTRMHYAKANISSFYVQRLINCNTQERHPVKELLAVFNPT